jgi:hypothetical protein
VFAYWMKKKVGKEKETYLKTEIDIFIWKFIAGFKIE